MKLNIFKLSNNIYIIKTKNIDQKKILGILKIKYYSLLDIYICDQEKLDAFEHCVF